MIYKNKFRVANIHKNVKSHQTENKYEIKLSRDTIGA